MDPQILLLILFVFPKFFSPCNRFCQSVQTRWRKTAAGLIQNEFANNVLQLRPKTTRRIIRAIWNRRNPGKPGKTWCSPIQKFELKKQLFHLAFRAPTPNASVQHSLTVNKNDCPRVIKKSFPQTTSHAQSIELRKRNRMDFVSIMPLCQQLFAHNTSVSPRQRLIRMKNNRTNCS